MTSRPASNERLQDRARPDERELTALTAFMETLPPRRGRRLVGRSDARRSLFGLAAVVLVAVVLAIALAGRAPSVGTSPRLVVPSGANPTTSGVPTGLLTFTEGGLVFEYPASWREYHYTEDSSFSHQVAYLATVEIPVPCATTVTPSFTEVACAHRYQLVPDSLVVSISSGGMPDFSITGSGSVGATPLTVGGLPAYFESAPATPPADLSLVWTISMPGAVDNFYRLQADLRGPGLDQMRSELDSMITSLRYDPPVVPLPTGSAAAAGAATSALASLVKDSSVWTCFSLSGSRQMLIDSMPDGPPLAQPQLATCTMKIEATPLRLWRMTLSLRLEKPDPNVGAGETFIVWVNPDGTLGATSGGPLVP